jgi:CRISPR system Cascade subunit CasD
MMPTVGRSSSSIGGVIGDAPRFFRLLAIAVPRAQGKSPLSPRRLLDYHTVQNAVTAEGKQKDTHLTYRQYLTDAAFAAVLSGERGSLAEAVQALDDPKWGLWFGRKACIPAEPVLVGLFDSEGRRLGWQTQLFPR